MADNRAKAEHDGYNKLKKRERQVYIMATIDFNKSYAQNQINSTKLQDLNRTQNAELAKVNQAKAKTTAGVGENVARSSADAVILTDTAKKLNAAQERAKNASGVDNSKVAALKKALADGTYSIDYQRLASNMVASESELNSIFG